MQLRTTGRRHSLSLWKCFHCCFHGGIYYLYTHKAVHWIAQYYRYQMDHWI